MSCNKPCVAGTCRGGREFLPGDPGTIHYKKTDPRAISPSRANPEDAGLDLYALDEVVIRPGEVVKIHTGIHVIIPEGESLQFVGKSGRAYNIAEEKPVGMAILAGLIDGPYRGELVVVAANCNTGLVLRRVMLGSMPAMKGILERNPLTPNLERVYEDATIRIPYGKACVQMVSLETKINKPVEICAARYDDQAATSRGDKGFGSSDLPVGG